MIFRFVNGLVQLFECTSFNKFVSNSLVTMCSHRPGRHDATFWGKCYSKFYECQWPGSGLAPIHWVFGRILHMDSSVINAAYYHYCQSLLLSGKCRNH